MKQYDVQPISKIYIAQQLLRMGNPIVDVQKNKHNAEKAVFYFNRTPKFLNDYKYIIETQIK